MKLVGLVVLALSWAAPASADEHIVRQGESLPQLAEQFYGDARKATLIALASGIAEVDRSLIAGERLRIPAPELRTVEQDDTWETLAQRLLGDERRAFAMHLANQVEPTSRPVPGAEVVVPAVLSYRIEYGDWLPQLAERFYGNREAARLIKRFNFMTTTRLDRGQMLLLPMPELRLTSAAQAATQGARSARSDGRRPAQQPQAEAPIRELDHLLRIGAYVEVVTAGSRLLGGEHTLSGNQIVSIQRALGIAHVALDRPDLAIAAFRVALRHQPDLEWNPITTSPKVMRIWQQARGNR